MHYLRRDNSICSTFLQRFTINIYLGSHWNFFWLHTIEVRGMATLSPPGYAPAIALPILIDWLVPSLSFFHGKATMVLYVGWILTRWGVTGVLSNVLLLLPISTKQRYSKRRDAFYLRTKQCHEGASWTADLSIMTTVKTTLDHTADHVSRSKYIHVFCYALCALSTTKIGKMAER